MAALRAGHAEVVSCLLGCKAALEVADVAGETAFKLAAKAGHAVVVGLLLEAKASVDAQNTLRPR